MNEAGRATRKLLVGLLKGFYGKKGDVWVISANTPHGGQFEDAPQVLFISSPIDDPDDQDRVWLD